MPDPHFSHRTAWEFRPNPLTQLLLRLRSEGKEIRDWTIANPTLCGFPYDSGRIAAALTQPSAFVYAPEPAGHLSARAAIAGFLASGGASVSPDRIFLTASSSEGYSHLFRLLCDAGESVAIPKPGYPLFDDLARLHDVRLQTYRIRYAGGWQLDEDSVRRAITPETRAIVVIHPNNPTGTFLSPGEQQVIARIAREFGLAIIADEVFLTFPFQPHSAVRSCALLRAPLIFTLNGLSKMAGLPQMKLGWIAVHGEAPLVGRTVQRLDMIGDTFLSVNTPVQVAVPEILAAAEAVGESIRSRVAANYALLGAAMKGSAISVLHAEGGWNAILQFPKIRSDEEWAAHLLTTKGLLVYPGHFFDLPFEAGVVVSLLPREEEFLKYVALVRESIGDGGFDQVSQAE